MIESPKELGQYKNEVSGIGMDGILQGNRRKIFNKIILK